MKAPVACRNIGAASELLRNLANPSRLAIICLLLEGERSVMELEAALGLHQPTLSQQLAVLRRAGLIAGRRTARQVYYRVSDERAAGIVAALRGLFPPFLPASALLTVDKGDTSRADLIKAGVLARLAGREMM
jgi:DNA-binding transcriptional ArsR family regulator